MLRYENSEWLFLLVLIPIIILGFILSVRWRKKAIGVFGQLKLVYKLMPMASEFKLRFKFILFTIAIGSLIIGIANPQIGSKMEEVKREGVDLMIAIDLSNSMLAEDLQPNRLMRAKQSISKLIDRLDGDRIGLIVFAGDACAKPILQSLDFASKRGSPYDLSSLNHIVSSGMTWSPKVKHSLWNHCDATMTDKVMAVEGVLGISASRREAADSDVRPSRFDLVEGALFLSESGEVLDPNEEGVGRVATNSLVPTGYWKDQEKSVATFLEIDGVRYSAFGEYVSVNADGSFVLLGRDEVSINTADEKIFPGEIEEIIKQYKGVADCMVVGASDGEDVEKIVALISSEDESDIDGSAIKEFVQGQLADSKVPDIVLKVVEIRRSPTGNGDYRWGKVTAIKQSQK